MGGDHCGAEQPQAAVGVVAPASAPAHDHGKGADHGHNHDHGVSVDSDRRWLGLALALIVTFMAAEVTVGILAHSLALITDAAHMLTDAVSIVLALIAIRLSLRPAGGRFTYGYKRAEILSAQANGITLLLLAVWFVYEGIQRLIDPPDVEGPLVLVTALFGIVVNILAAWCISKANRSSLNVEGAFQHILNDLYAFIGTAIAGAVVWLAGWARADAIAALVVAALMFKAGWGLVRESGRIFLEAAPAHLDPDAIGARLVGIPPVVEVHDLHVWVITSGQPSLSAHVLVDAGADCHAARSAIEAVLHDEFGLEHTTLQVDHVGADAPPADDLHCADAHGPVHRS
ncbi:cation diffusion facilitator family transporter [Nocardia sp. NPDC048505]|uniref:cation diffusion facilitator family transporter n=1 Tax=unclassified Nocardia TaxID=2637762 RepID=UPI0033E73F31